jgi:hypothetical protein
MAVIELRRRCGGRTGPGRKSDFRVFMTKKKADSQSGFALGVRVSESVLKKVRWLEGDNVTVDFDSSTDTFTMRRVTDDSGNALSGQGKDGRALTVRYVVDQENVSLFGVDPGKGCDCELVTVTGDAVLFKRN